MGARVTNVDASGVDVQTSNGTEHIDAHTVVWAAGVQASPLAAQLADGHRAPTSTAPAASPRSPTSRCLGIPKCSWSATWSTLDNLPGVAEVAMQGSLHAANTIARRLARRDAVRPFRYRDLGSVATIGRFRAVCSFWRFRLSGLPAWLVWMFVHLAFLNGFGSRLSTMMPLGSVDGRPLARRNGCSASPTPAAT